MHFNLVDVALLAVFGLAVADGLKRGFALYASELSAFALGLCLAFALFEPLGRLAHQTIGIGQGIAGFGAFLLLLFIGHNLAQAPFQKLARWSATRLEERLRPNLHRAAGAVPALGIAVIVAALGLSAMVVLGGGQPGLVSSSALASPIIGGAAFIRPPLQSLLLPASREGNRILDRAPDSNPGEDTFYRLQFPPDLVVEVDASSENRMLERLNRVRADRGLSPLRMDLVLQEAARGHSRDMYQRRYFSHRTPDGKTPFDRLRDLKIRYVTAGENIAFAPDPEQAWDSLMKSPDHRANILNPDFRCVGIGVYRGLNGYEEMFTQDFADCSG